MEALSISTYFFSFLAGTLTVLSPCVLPVLPFVTGASLSKSAWGPVALSVGLLITFIGVTLIVSQIGNFFGIDASSLRIFSGVVLSISGLLFVWESLQNKFSELLSRVTSKVPNSEPNQNSSIIAQLGSGMLLGLVWTPCSGPSLGTALGLATEAGTWQRALSLLLFFGLGAAIPLLAIAYGGRAFFQSLRKKSEIFSIAKKIIGLLIIAFGILIAIGLDRKLEASVTSILPGTWLEFVTKF
ncbi:MAG: putative cytochrome c biosis-related protein [Bacteriovoracaceae bacterium]|nr:putative cytochrome c biosis-related protein [Bacteriovoracaceae bacterium]